MAYLGVVGPIATDTGDRFIARDLIQQGWQHGRIAHRVDDDLDTKDFQALRIDGQMRLCHWRQ
jgi:hypothetical protein